MPDRDPDSGRGWRDFFRHPKEEYHERAANVVIDGTGRAVPLTEVQPGVYEGTYTVRRQDRITPAQVSAALQANGRTVRSRLATATAAPASAHVQNVSPRQGERVAAPPVTISGSLASNVDPRSVRIILANVDVTGDATVTTNGFTKLTLVRR